MGDNAADLKTGTSSSKPPTENGPIIKESQESEEYQQDLQVVLGTAFGVIAVVGLIALTFLLYRIYKARHAAFSYEHNEELDALERDIVVDVGGKSQPVLLLLYAYDCEMHEKVVGALAGFLMEACGLTVTLDLLEENEIIERGIDDWLVDRLQEADYILVLCSLGARLRCSKKRVRFKSDNHHVLPDYFAVAVDYVAEKMRAEKQKGLGMNKFLTAYMEYSTRSDIPPQLETASQFCLMKDIHKLHVHLNTQGPDTDKSETASQSSTCENHYYETETGALLKAAIEQAKLFFRENPSWIDDRLQPVNSHKANTRKQRKNSVEQPLLMLMGTPLAMQCAHDNNFSNLCNIQNTYPHHPQKTQCDSSQHLSNPIHDKVRSVNLFNTLPRGSNDNEQYGLGNSGLFQVRQNSLPSSLDSSCLAVPSARNALSKSMDSFAMDQSILQERDGLPCLYCNSTHMDLRPECLQFEQTHGRGSIQFHASSNLSPEQDIYNVPSTTLGPTRSQTTVLQAEVHQEWDNSNKNTPEKKCATFAGDPRTWNSDLNLPLTVTPYQSLPPHHPPISQNDPSLDAWESAIGLHRWKSGCQESSCLQGFSNTNREHHLNHRTFSDISLSTEDSDSVSDGDSLERDLRSIQNISSFHEFVVSSSFIGQGGRNKTMTPLPSPCVEMSTVLNPLGEHLEQQRNSCAVQQIEIV